MADYRIRDNDVMNDRFKPVPSFPNRITRSTQSCMSLNLGVTQETRSTATGGQAPQLHFIYLLLYLSTLMDIRSLLSSSMCDPVPAGLGSFGLRRQLD